MFWRKKTYGQLEQENSVLRMELEIVRSMLRQSDHHKVTLETLLNLSKKRITELQQQFNNGEFILSNIERSTLINILNKLVKPTKET